MPSTTISRGNILTAYVFTTSITPALVLTVTSAEQSVSVPGVQVGDIVSTVIPPSAQTAGIIFSYARVTAANTVALSFGNPTAGSVTPVAGLYTFHVVRPESLPLPTSGI